MFIQAILSLLIITPDSVFAQNSWGPITRPFTRLHSQLAPSSVGFENNLMNHISDELRVDNQAIKKPISCVPTSDGKVVHKKGGRVIPIKCQNTSTLSEIRKKVTRFYGHQIGMHLKYAFKSGPYIFGICNYDESSEHKHSDHHYVCRTPIEGLSKSNNSETFCYKMGAFHRTCNPHKALVSSEIILLNSKRRWASLDLEILLRQIKNNQDKIPSSLNVDKFIDEMKKSRVEYSNNRRGSATADKRFPKAYFTPNLVCHEDLISSDDQYLETSLTCATAKVKRRAMRTKKPSMDKVLFRIPLYRLKQAKSFYPMLGGEKSSIVE